MTPAQLAAVNAEHSHQRALFAWANIAERYGFAAAWDERTYTKEGMGALQARAECVVQDWGATATIPEGVEELRWLHAIPNGGYRDKATAGKLKAEGVKRGIPDIFLPVPMIGRFCGLYVEMKRPETSKDGKRKARIIDQAAGSTSSLQDEAIGYLRHVGYAVSVCFTWEAAAREIESYIIAVRQSAA